MIVLPLPMPTTRAGRGKWSWTAACAASLLAFSIVERPDGSGKVSLMGGCGLDMRFVSDVPVQDDLVDIVAVNIYEGEGFVMNFVMSRERRMSITRSIIDR